MTWKPKSGDRINTPFGPGTVVEVTIGGVVKAKPDSKPLQYGFPLSKISPLDVVALKRSSPEDAPPQVAPVPPPIGAFRRPARHDGSIHLLRDVEALRFGLVPAGQIAALTIGFDKYREWIEPNLPQSRPMISEVVGPFGTGKSHMMALVRHLARQIGYVTCQVEVDGTNISLAHPDKTLHALWSTLRKPNGNTIQLLDLYRESINNRREAPRIQEFYPEAAPVNYESVRTLIQQGQLDVVSDQVNGFLSSSGEMTMTDLRRHVSQETGTRSGTLTFRKPVAKTLNGLAAADFVTALAAHAKLAKNPEYSLRTATASYCQSRSGCGS